MMHNQTTGFNMILLTLNKHLKWVLELMLCMRSSMEFMQASLVLIFMVETQRNLITEHLSINVLQAPPMELKTNKTSP